MNSYGADRQACEHYGVPSTNVRNNFSFPEQILSQYSNTHDLPRSRALEASRNDVNLCGDQPAGPGHNSCAAGQRAKRLRSNSDEASVSRLSQVLAWLPRASSDDVEKIWVFLRGMYQASSVV